MAVASPEKPLEDQFIFKRRTQVLQRSHDSLKVGDEIHFRYQVINKLGIGSHSMVFEAYDKMSRKNIALKVFKQMKRALTEMDILMNLGKSEHFCAFVDYVVLRRLNHVVAMELQGPNLSEVLGYFKPLSVLSAMKIGIQMLDAIEKLHTYGYLHCDVKPSNFAVGLPPDNMHRVILMDFSLSRPYTPVNPDDPPKKYGFIGTLKYASPNIHKRRKISKRDDLWSLFYALIDLRQTLPWAHHKRDHKVLSAKILSADYLAEETICKEFKSFKRHVHYLSYNDTPNYDKLRRMLTKIWEMNGGSTDFKFEWQRQPYKMWKITTKDNSALSVSAKSWLGYGSTVKVCISQDGQGTKEAKAGPSRANN